MIQNLASFLLVNQPLRWVVSLLRFILSYGCCKASNFIFGHQTFDPVTLFWCGAKIVLLQSFGHVFDELALLWTDAGVVGIKAIKKCFEFLNLLAERKEICGWYHIMRLGCIGCLPLAVGIHIAVPGAQSGQFIGSLIQIMTGMPTHPFKHRGNFATVEQHTIQRPEVGICLHSICTLGHLDGIFTVAIDFQGEIWGSNT